MSAPRPTPEDLARWRELVKQARTASAGAPSMAVPGLKRAADAARKAVVPSGELNADNPAVKLVRMARRYLGETTSGRRELQAELGRLAEAVAAELTGMDAIPARARRARADIDG